MRNDADADRGDAVNTPQPGRWRHYKGGLYELLGVATHSESGERLVVYRPLYGERGLWVRPLGMFLESVEIDGKRVPRFERIGD
ncbi:MAG: DUF1653 domain-containing protein [Gammaproteobacteria bacterium]